MSDNTAKETDNDGCFIIILMTSGPSTPERCATPFFIASLLASMDAKVKIFLTMEAVRLAVKDVADTLVAKKGGKTIIEFIREAKEVGVNIYMCLPALPGFDINATEDIIEEIDEFASGGVLADLLISCDKVISF